MNILRHRYGLFGSASWAPENDAGSIEAAMDAIEALDNPQTTTPAESDDNGAEPRSEETPTEPRAGLEDGHEELEETDGDGEGDPETGAEGEGLDQDGGDQQQLRSDPFSSVADDAEVTVGDQKIKFGELKALAGQAMALNTAGQNLLKQREEVSALQTKYLDGLKAVHAGAKSRWDELTKIDTNAYKASASPDEWATFEQYVNKTYAELKAAESAVNGLEPEVTEAQNAARQERMVACARALQDPATGIPGYGQEAHDANVKFAKDMGLSDETLNELSDPNAWKIINLAAKQARAEKVIETKIKPKQTTRGATPANKGGSGKGSGKSNALARLQKSGSTDDAISALIELDSK